MAQQLVPTEQRALRVRTELAEHAQHLASNAWCCAHICVRLGWVALGISAMIEIPKAPSEFFKSCPPRNSQFEAKSVLRVLRVLSVLSVLSALSAPCAARAVRCAC